MNLSMGIKKLEFAERIDKLTEKGAVFAHATFEIKADEMLTADLTITVPWQNNLAATQTLAVQKLAELGGEIMAKAQKSLATPIPQPPVIQVPS